MKRSPVLFLLVTAFLFAVCMSLVFPVLPFIVAQYVPDIHQQATVIGWLAALYALLSFFSGPVLGAVSDAVGRRPVLIVSLLGMALGNLLFGIGGSLGMLFFGRFLEGVTSGGLGALMAYIADSTDEDDRGKVFGQIGATIGAGMIIGPAIGGALAHFGYSAPMYAAAGFALLNALWGYFFLPESLKPENRQREFQPSHLNPLTHIRAVLAYPVVRRLISVSLLFTLPFTLMQVVLPLLTRDSLGWGAAQVSTVYMVVGVCDIIGQGLLLPTLLRLFGERKVATIGLLMGMLGLAGLALTPLLHSAPLLYTTLVIFALGEGSFTAAFNTLISFAIPASEQGRLQGGVQALGEVTQIVGPLAGGQLYSRLGGGPTFGVGAGLVALALGLLLGQPTMPAQTEAQPEAQPSLS